MRKIIATAAALLLSACITAPPAAPTACPRIAFVPDADVVFHYLPGKAGDETALVSRAALGGYRGYCETPEAGKIRVNMFLDIAAQPGAAHEGKGDSYDYFVAVLSPEGTPLARQAFHCSIDFDKDAKDNTNWLQEDLVETIPLPAGSDPGAWQIAIGFQLTPEELEFNRGRDRK